MSFLSKLFGKKKVTVSNNDRGDVFYPEGNDGQDLYFKEDFEEKPKKRSAPKKQEPQLAKEDSAPVEKATIKRVKSNESEPKIKAELKTANKSNVKEPAKKASSANLTAKVSTRETSAETKTSNVKNTTPKVENKTVKLKSTAQKYTTSKTAEAAIQKPAKTVKSGKFEIKKAKDGRFVFNLYAPNHIIVATSQVYSSSSAALNGIQSIITNAEKAPIEDNTLKNPTKQPFPKWEMYIDKGGEYRFRLYATNGNCVVHSQGYKQKSSCKNGIESIIRCSKNPEIDKSYLKKD